MVGRGDWELLHLRVGIKLRGRKYSLVSIVSPHLQNKKNAPCRTHIHKHTETIMLTYLWWSWPGLQINSWKRIACCLVVYRESWSWKKAVS